MRIYRSVSNCYRTPVQSGFIWTAASGFLSAPTLDMGESFAVWRHSAVVYAFIYLLIIVRRPTAPIAIDLLAPEWGLPLLYFPTQLVYSTV